MGQILKTTDQIIQKEIADFSNFRRTLPAADQKAFDALFAAARKHTAAINMADHALPFESILLAMLIEQQRQLEELKKQLNAK